MIKSVKRISVCLIIILAYALLSFQLQKERDTFFQAHFVNYALPSKLIGPMALEFKGPASDFLLLKLMTFIGGEFHELKASRKQHYNYIKQALETITDLDPYFWDAYLFAEALLAWDAGDHRGANDLLLKGRKYRPNDYRLPYYLGFNHYYFLKDNKNGARFLMEASRLPGSPSLLATLAARLSAYDSDYQIGILFLKEMLRSTTDDRITRRFKARLQVLESLDMLEKKVALYEKIYRKKPSSLDQLVVAGLIKKIPEDPYGGEFVLLEHGRVYTTSKMVKRK